MSSSKKIVSKDGEPILSARKTAARLKCAPDYVSKLCREGKLQGLQVEGQWFVFESSIEEFDAQRRLAKKQRSEILSNQRRSEHISTQLQNSALVERAILLAKYGTELSANDTIGASQQEPMLSTRKTATKLKCAPDYVSKLCREGKLKGEQIDGQWFVFKSSIDEFEKNRFVAKQQRAQQLAEERRNEQAKYQIQSSTLIEQCVMYGKKILPRVPVGMIAGVALLLGALAFASSLHELRPGGKTLGAAVSQSQLPFFGLQAPSIVLPVHAGNAFAGATNFLSGVFATLFGGTQQPSLADEFTPWPAAPVPQQTVATTTTVAYAPLPYVPSLPVVQEQPTSPANSTANSTINSTSQNSSAPVTTNTPAVAGPTIININGVTEDELGARLLALTTSLQSQIALLQNPGRESPLQNFAIPERIDNLSNVRLNGTTKADTVLAQDVNTGTLEADSATIGDLAVTGNFNLSGNLILGTTTLTDLVVTNTSTSTFAGGVDIAGLASVNSLLVHNSATFLGPLNFSGDTIFNNATSTHFFADTASSTNLSALNASIANLTVGSLNITGATTVSGDTQYTGLLTFNQGFISQASSTVDGNFTTTGANNFGGLTMFSNGYISNASSTVQGNFTVSGNSAVTGALSVSNLSTLNGFVSAASSTIGGGTPTTGLTVNGGATTTGDMYVGGALTIAGSLTSSVTSGQIQFLATPQGTGIGQGTMFINPPTAGTNNVLLGLAVNGNERARIDSEGDVQIVGTFNSTNSTGTNSLSGNLNVLGNTTLGASSTNTIAFNGQINSDIIPSADSTYSLGSSAKRFANIYASTLTIENLVAGGTASSTFVINAGNVSSDAQDATLAFSRGVVAPNATLKWNSTLKRFEFNNFPVDFANAINVEGSGTSTIAGNLALTATPTGTGLSQGSLYINPTSGSTDFTVLGVGVNGVERFRVDAEGDTTIQGSLGLQNSLYNISGDTLVVDDKLQINGNILKDSAGTTRLTLGSTNTFVGNLDVGSAAITSGLINGQTISSAANFTGSLNVAGNTTLASATSTNFAISNIASGNILKTTTGGAVIAATAGVDFVTGSGLAAAYPFGAAGNATSTLTQFNGGLTAFSSSTIGSGAQTTGLTVSGGATTTLNAYFASKVGIGTSTPMSQLAIQANTNSDALTIVNGNSGWATGVQVLDEVGNVAIQLNGFGSANSYAPSGGQIATYNNLVLGTDTNVSSGGTHTISFLTGGYNQATQTRMTIGANGNVGIGTTSPWRTFSVNGNSDLGTSALAGFFTATSTTASSFAGGFTAFASSTIGNGTLGLTVNGPATTTGRAYFANNVGVGTTSPSQAFAVQGNSYVSGTSFFGGAVTATSTLTVSGLSTLASLKITGSLTDSLSSAGSNGMVLQSTGSATKWVAPSTLGLGNGTFLGLSDTLNAYVATRVLFESSSGITDSSGLTFDGSTLGASNITDAGTLNVLGVTGLATTTINSGGSTTAAPLSVSSQNGNLSLFIGTGSTVGLTADQFSSDIRYNGSGVNWGDLAYYPNGGGNGNAGNFRFSLAGSTVDVVPDAKLGVGSLYSAGSVGIATTSPWRTFSVNGNSDLGTSALAGFFTATSTTGTSAFAGNITVSGSTTLNGFISQASSTVVGNFTNSGNHTIGGLLAVNSASGTSTFAASVGISNNLTVSGTSYFSDGTTAVPSITFSSNTGYGLSFSTNVINFSTAGARTALLNSTGFAMDNTNGPALDNASSLGSSPVIRPNRGDSTTGFAAGTVNQMIAIAGGIEITRWNTTGFGIGTTSPFYKLSVEGTSSLGNQAIAGFFTATSTTGTSVFSGNLTVSGNTTHTGTAYFASNVGIGSTTPASRLVINQPNTTASPYAQGLLVTSTGTQASVAIGALDDAAGSHIPSVQAFSSTLGTVSTLSLNLAGGAVSVGTSSSLSKFIVAGNATIGADYNVSAPTNGLLVEGNVGIGTTSPSKTFAVQGNSYVSGTSFFGGAITATSTFNLSGLASLGSLTVSGDATLTNATSTAFFATTASSTNLFAQTGSIGTLSAQTLVVSGTGTSTIAGGLRIGSSDFLSLYADANNSIIEANANSLSFRTSRNTDDIIFTTNNIEDARFDATNGFFGINNATPAYSLDVKGFINTDSTLGGYKMGGTTILTASSTDRNTFVGLFAGDAFNPGVAEYNTAVGNLALTVATSSKGNVAIGYNTLSSLNDADTAAGTFARNTAIGYASMDSATTGFLNTAVGNDSLSALTTGKGNAALGSWALANSNGDYNSAVGYESLFNNTTGTRNAGFGGLAAFNNTSGTDNAAFGHASLFIASSSAAQFNSAFGSLTAEYASTTGLTAIGYAAGGGASTLYVTGANNTLVGYLSGNRLTTGANNILIGASPNPTSYTQVTTGSQNISIGYNVAVPDSTASGQLNIGNYIYGTGLTGQTTSVSSGSIGLGTTTPWGNLAVANSGGSTPGFVVSNSSNVPQFLVSSTGNVGISSTSPNTTLTVGGGSVVGNVRISNLSAGNGIFADNGQSSGVFSLTRQANGAGNADLSISANTGVGISGGSTAYNNAVTANYDFYVSSSHRVGVGSTTPWANLSVVNAGSGPAFVIGGGTGGINPQFTVDVNGNVGIGTTSPNSFLSVRGGSVSTAVNTGVAQFGASPAASSVGVELGTYTGGYGMIQAMNFTTGAAGSLQVNPFGGGATIVGVAGGSLSVSTSSNAYRTTLAGSSGTGYLGVGSIAPGDIFNINSSGNVGIGTTSPLYKLSVEGSSTLGNQALAGFFTATSTTGTSAFAGNFTVSGNSLFANASSTAFSSNTFAVGGTGTTSIASNGALTTPTLTVSGLTPSRFVTTGAGGLLGTSATLANLISSLSDVSGSTGTTNLVLSASPTFTGTATFANIANTGTFNVTGATNLTTLGAATTTINAGGDTTAAPLTVNSQNGNLSLFIGTGSTVGLTADQFSSDIRYNGSGVNWGDLAYYPNGGGNGNAGNFRFSLAGSTVDVVPDAKLGVGSLYSASSVGIATTSPWRTFSVNGNSDLGTSALAGFFTATSTTASSFAGGLTAFASSTIGGATQATGLTVNGGATTTLNAYFGSRISVATTSAASIFNLSGNMSIGADYSVAAPTNGLIVEGQSGFGTSSPSNAPFTSSVPLVASVPSNASGCILGFSRVSTMDGCISGLGGAFTLNAAGANGNTGLFQFNIATALNGTQTAVFNLRNYQATVGTSSITTASAGHFNIWGRGCSATGGSLCTYYMAVTNSDVGSLSHGDIFNINSLGKVGVGTTTPWGQLSASSTSATVPGLVVQQNSTGPTAIFLGGSVGVGTTSPWAQLSVNPNVIGTGPEFAVGSSTKTDFVITNTGNIGIGTTTPGAALDIYNGALCVDDNTPTCQNAARTAGTIYAVSTAITGIDLAERYPTHDPTLGPGDIVGFDPANPVFVEHATSSGSFLGVVSTAPGIVLGGYNSQLYKNNAQVPIALSGRVPVKVNLEGGDIAVGDPITISSVAGVGAKATVTTQTIGVALEPYTAAMATSSTGTIQVFIKPELTFSSKDRTQLSDIVAGTATTTAAELAVSSSTNLFSLTLRAAVAGLGQTVVRTFNGAISATVGVFNKVFAHEVHTDKLCISDNSGETCISKTQLDAMLAGQQANVSGASSGSTTPSQNTSGTTTVSDITSDTTSSTSTASTTSSQADTVAPTITVNGNNPATITVGSTYSDLGATVTDNVDHNLGYKVSLNGGPLMDVSQLSLDTSTSTTYTILFSATDTAGNTGTATRTVMVQ